MSPQQDWAHVGCKVNLGLRITGRRDDGYHLLDSLFWPLPEPHDRMTFALRPEPGVHLLTDADLPAENTVTRAHAAYVAAHGQKFDRADGVPGLSVHLEKGIPSGAGLGGGSADAACLLAWLNAHVAQPLTAQELASVALRVGADCPFFLQDRPCRVQGIGDVLTPLATAVSRRELLLVCPDVHVDTPWAYRQYDAMHDAAQDTPGMQKAGALTKSAQAATNPTSFPADAPLVNDLEPPVFAGFPQLAAIKTQLLELGAQTACMSGSGASMLGLFAPGTAQHAADALAGQGLRVFTMPLEYAGM